MEGRRAIVVVAIVCVPGLAPAADASWTAPASLTAPAETTSDAIYWEAGIDNRGRITAAWSDFERVYVRTVSPDGQASTEELALLPQSWGFDLAVAPTGEAMVTLQNRNEVAVALREAGGFFGRPVRVSSGEGERHSVDARIGRHGEAVVTWQRSVGYSHTIEAARRPPRGAFGRPEVVAGDERNPHAPRLEMDADGNALLSWSEPAEAHDARLWVARGSGRERFERPRPLTGVTSAPGLASIRASADGAAVASWVEYHRRGAGLVVVARAGSIRGGFGPRRVLGTATEDWPAQAAGADDEAVVAWRGRRGSRGTGRELRMAVAKGGRFGPGRRLTLHAPKSIVAAVDGRGEPTVAWRQKIGPRHEVRSAFGRRGRRLATKTLLVHRGPSPPTRLWLDASGRRSVVFVLRGGWSSPQRLDAAVRRSGRSFGPVEPLAVGVRDPSSPQGDLPSPDVRLLASPGGDIFAAWRRWRWTGRRALGWVEFARYTAS